MAKTQVDYSRALKKTRAARKDIEKQGDLSLQDLAKEGMYKAKAIAPYDTGLTAKAVRTRFLKREDGSEVQIIAPNAHKSEFAKRDGSRGGKFGASFNLTRYMHSGKGIAWFAAHGSGRSDFMNLTAEYLRRIKKTTANNRMQKIKLKYGQ